MIVPRPPIRPRAFATRFEILFVIIAVLVHAATVLAQKIPLQNTQRENASTGTMTTEQQVQAAINNAIARLESGDVVGFIEFYAPVDELRQARKGRLGKSFTRIQTPAARADVIKRFKLVKNITPQINLGGFLATFTIPEPTEESANATTTVPQAEISQEPLAGYPGSLNDALEQAIADLKADRLDSFIDRLLPRGELGHPEAATRRKQLTSRLKQHPQMAEQMLKDLQSLLQRNEIRKASGNNASILIKGKLVPGTRGRQIRMPDRTFTFVKVEGFWRFQDTTSKLVSSQAKIAAKAPPSMAEFGAADVVIMERFGDQWRFAEF